MLLILFTTITMMTGSGPMHEALSATEAPTTLRAAFTVELQSQRARRVYAFDPRKKGAERWKVLAWEGEDDELEQVAANWAAEAAPDGRLFPDDLRASLGGEVRVDDLKGAWRIGFHHAPSSNDGEFDVWAAQRLEATAWLDPVGERFLRIDYRLPKPVPGPQGGRLDRYEQSYFIRTEPRWGMSYVSGYSVDLEARAGMFHKIDRRYSAKIVKVDFFFASAEAQSAFEAARAPKPQRMSRLGP